MQHALQMTRRKIGSDPTYRIFGTFGRMSPSAGRIGVHGGLGVG